MTPCSSRPLLLALGKGFAFIGRQQQVTLDGEHFFKSFPVQSDEHGLTVLRYVEQNPPAARLISRAGQWHWSSLWARLHGG